MPIHTWFIEKYILVFSNCSIFNANNWVVAFTPHRSLILISFMKGFIIFYLLNYKRMVKLFIILNCKMENTACLFQYDLNYNQIPLWFGMTLTLLLFVSFLASLLPLFLSLHICIPAFFSSPLIHPSLFSLLLFIHPCLFPLLLYLYNYTSTLSATLLHFS